MQKGDWLGLLTVIAILVGIGLFFAYAPEAKPDVYAPVEVTGSSVTVGAQTGEQSVRVTAEVKQPSFITVHQALGEAPGPVIGVSGLLAPGSYAPLSIALPVPIVPTNDYFILMFLDDGDGVFEAGVDLPIMSDGQVIKVKLSL